MNPAPENTPAPESRWLKLAHSLVTCALALAATVITALLVLGYVSVAKDAVAPIFKFESEVSHVAIGLTLLFIVLLPLVVLFVASRKGWLTWPILAAAWLVVIPILGWLAWDDNAIRQPLPLEQFSPAFAGAEQSYGVLMRYSKAKPSEEATKYGAMKWTVSSLGKGPDDAAKWREVVGKNRVSLEADWEKLAPQRRWLEELNAFERIGDLTPARFDADLIRFDVWRTLSRMTSAHATLLALDGHGDEAIATLVPLIEVGRKLQPSARTLVRFMIAVVVERVAVETAANVLDLTAVSAESKARLAAALAGRNPAAGARRIVLMEYATFAPVFGTMKFGEQFALTHGGVSRVLRRPLNFVSALFFNPNATTNMYGDRVFELAALAEARELGKFAVQAKGLDESVLERGGMKNLGGRLLLVMAMPSYQKLLESYWKVEDKCAALAARVAAK